MRANPETYGLRPRLWLLVILATSDEEMGARPLSLITYDVLVTVSWIREILPQVISVTQKIVLTSLRHVNAAADNLTRNELYLLCLTPMNFLAIILLTK